MLLYLLFNIFEFSLIAAIMYKYRVQIITYIVSKYISNNNDRTSRSVNREAMLVHSNVLRIDYTYKDADYVTFIPYNRRKKAELKRKYMIKDDEGDMCSLNVDPRTEVDFNLICKAYPGSRSMPHYDL